MQRLLCFASLLCLGPVEALRGFSVADPPAPAPATLTPEEPATAAAAPAAAAPAVPAVAGDATKGSATDAKATDKQEDEPKPDGHRDIMATNNDTMTEEAFDAAEPIFGDLDCLTRDSIITINEAATYGVKNGVPWSEIKPIFEHIDANGDGQITKEEFNKDKDLHRKFLEDLRAGFTDVDFDGDNLISNKEWIAWCNGWMTPHPTLKTCKSMFEAADTMRPKGEIDRSEFENAGRRCHSIDDGDCDDHKASKDVKDSKDKSNLLQGVRERSLAEFVRTGGPRNGAELFKMLLHRHHKL